MCETRGERLFLKSKLNLLLGYKKEKNIFQTDYFGRLNENKCEMYIYIASCKKKIQTSDLSLMKNAVNQYYGKIFLCDV